MSVLFIIIGIFLGIIFLLIGIIYLRHFIPLRPEENGFKFVYINDDGTVRELYQDEMEYLEEEFHPTDGARPYIKSRYSSLAPDDRMSGFIPRNRVPKKIIIKPVVSKNRKKVTYTLDKNGATGVFSKVRDS